LKKIARYRNNYEKGLATLTYTPLWNSICAIPDEDPIKPQLLSYYNTLTEFLPSLRTRENTDEKNSRKELLDTIKKLNIK
jgi:hypothetical protein